MQLIISGKEREKFVNGLSDIIEIKDRTECIIVEIDDILAQTLTTDNNKYMTLIGKMKEEFQIFQFN